MSKPGRPNEKRLPYFNISSQDKILDDLEYIFGYYGVVLYLRLKQQLHNVEGYYLNTREDDSKAKYLKTVPLNAKPCTNSVPCNGFFKRYTSDRKNNSKIDGILQFLFDHDKNGNPVDITVSRNAVFDQEMYETHGILTGEEIQKFYFIVTKRRKELDINEKFLLPGIKEFIEELRSGAEEEEDEEQNKVQTLKETFTEIIQNIVKNENAINVDINSENADINTNNHQQKDNKGKVKGKGKSEAFENVPFSTTNVVTIAPQGDSDLQSNEEKEEKTKKPQTDPIHRAAFGKLWEQFAQQGFAPSSKEENIAVNSIIGKSKATAIFELNKINYPDDKRTPEIYLKMMEKLWEMVFDKQFWNSLPVTLNSHVDFKILSSRWNSIVAQLNKEEKPQKKSWKKGGFQKNTENKPTEPRNNAPRTKDTKTIGQLIESAQNPLNNAPSSEA